MLAQLPTCSDLPASVLAKTLLQRGERGVGHCTSLYKGEDLIEMMLEHLLH
jgi:hypothetical protein